VTTLATPVAAGTYNYLTVDAKGRVVGGSYAVYMLGGNNLSEVINAAQRGPISVRRRCGARAPQQ
jgi:phage-related tail fiber protein